MHAHFAIYSVIGLNNYEKSTLIYSLRVKMIDTILANLRSYITSQILKQPDLTIAADEALISGGLIDSFSLVDLALYIEDTYGVRIDDTELNADTFDTLNQLAALIAERQL